MANEPEDLGKSDALEGARRTLRNNASIAAADLKALAESMRQLHNEGKTTNEDVRLMARHLSSAGDGADHLREAAQKMSEVLVQGAGSLTESGRKAHSATAEGLRDLAAAADQETAAHIQKDLAAHNRSRFDTLLKASPAEHAANIRSNFLQGSFEALQGTMLKGNPLASTIADLVGAIFPAVEAVGGLVMAFMALGEIIAITSKNTLDAAKSGLELGDSAVGMGASFGLAVDMATRGGTAVSQDQLTQYLGTARGLGVYGGAGSYASSLSMSAEDRTGLRLQAVAFVAALAQSGAALGVAGQDAVKFGTQITTLSHVRFTEGERNFYRMAAGAERLGIIMDPLMTMFTALAEKADFAGERGDHAADRMVSQTLSITEALQTMGSRGFEGFRNLDPAKMQAVSQSIMQAMMGMDDARVAALTMSSGQSWEQTLHRAASSDQFSLRRDAIMRARQMAGITGQGDISETQAQMLASISGVKGDIGMQTKMGHYLNSLAATGGDVNLGSKMAQLYDKRFSEERTVGENAMMGADPMQTLGAIMKDVLKVLVELAEVIIHHVPGIAAGAGKDSDTIAAQIRRGEAAQHAGNYGASQGGYRAPHASMHMGAG